MWKPQILVDVLIYVKVRPTFHAMRTYVSFNPQSSVFV